MKRRDVLTAAGSAPFLAGVGRAAEGVRGPSGVHIAMGRDPASMISIGWTGGPATTAEVRYREPGGTTTTAGASSAPVPGGEAVAYTATVTGLTPDTTYEYDVVLDGRTAGPFTTHTPPDASTGFTVTAVGDHGIADPDNPVQRANSDDPQRVMARAQSLDPTFQLLVGDIAYANGHPSTWDLYFDAFEDYFASTPFMTVPGNHEAEPGTGLTQYDRRLNDLMPVRDRLGVDDTQRKQRWWEITYDNTLFLGLSTTTDACGDVSRGEEFVPLYDPRCRYGGLTYGEAQERYARRALEAAANDPDVQWTVVFFHGPLWTDSASHADRRDLRKRWGMLFDEYDVDLVLSGDNHVYERTKPIHARTDRSDYGPDDAWDWGEYGTTFVTNGTGGTSHYAFADSEPAQFIARRTNDHFGVTELDVANERIRVRYVTVDGDVQDRFSIVKRDGHPTQVGDAFR